MKRKVMALSIILLGVFLATNYAHATDWRKLQEKLDPERKRIWVVIGDRETSNFFNKPMKRYRIGRHGYGFYYLDVAEAFAQSSYPLIIAFTPDQTSLEKIDPKHYYLFVIPPDKIKKILAEKKCVIVSRKIKTNAVTQILDDKGEWVVVSETKGESYVTLIAAPNKRTLKKAITHFFTLTEIPLEPIIWKPK